MSVRVDHRFSNNQSFYARLLYSDGDGRHAGSHGDAAPRARDAAADELGPQPPVDLRHQRRQRAEGRLQPAAATTPWRSDRPATTRRRSRSPGTVTSQSIDARGTTGIARSGLLVRATSNASTNGQAYNPRSISLSDALTMTRGAHTFKFGGEYRNIESQFQFLGSTEITYNGINEFIDNRPAQVAVALESPVFTPQQYYADRLRAGHLARHQPADARARPALRLLLRRQGEGRAGASRSSSRRTPSAPTRDNFYNPDKNNFAPRLSAVYQLTPKTALRAGYGHFYGPGQFEDRIQPIENFIERRRVQSTDVPATALAYPVDPARLPQPALGPRLHARAAGRVQHPVRRQRSQELPGAINLTVGYTGSKGRDMFLRGVANTFDNTTRLRQCRRSARSTTRRRAASTAW